MPVEDDYENTDSIHPSNFDELRIAGMDIGERIDSENGNFSVLRYKNDYTLIINIRTKNKNYLEFDNHKDLIEYLKKN